MIFVELHEALTLLNDKLYDYFVMLVIRSLFSRTKRVSISAHARNTPANMRDAEKSNFNNHYFSQFFYFIIIMIEKYAEKYYCSPYLVHEILRYCKNKMLKSDWLKHKLHIFSSFVNISGYLRTYFGVFWDEECYANASFGVSRFLKKFDGPYNISMTADGSRDNKCENMGR